MSRMVYRFIFFPACVTVGRHRVNPSNMCNILRKAQISENSTFYHSISKQRLMSSRNCQSHVPRASAVFNITVTGSEVE